MARPKTIEAIERATVEGVAPRQIQEIDGWLVPLDDGVIGRAKSAAPLSHDADPGPIAAIEAAYWTEGQNPAFRIAEDTGLRPVRAALTKRGYEGRQLTLVKTAAVERLARYRDSAGDLLERPDDAWAEVFTSDDPDGGAARVAAFRRAPDALYGAIREDGRTLAVGVVTFGHGWAGVHGMRTLAHARGRGYASLILTAFGRAAAERGIERIFLQVEEPNDARSLYRKAGFEKAWTYRYWTRGG